MTYLPATPTRDVTLSESIRKYTRKVKAKNTRKAYRCDLEHFAAYCEGQNVPALPATPATIAA
jgi:site-specific recombinase XerD